MGCRFLLFLVSTAILTAGTNGFLWDSYNVQRLFSGSDDIFEKLKPLAGNPTDQQCLTDFQYFVDELKREQDWTLEGMAVIAS